VKYDVHINGAKHAVAIEPLADGTFRAHLDGKENAANAVPVGSGRYSILLAGRSIDVSVQPDGDALHVRCDGRDFRAQVVDPRSWRAAAGGALEAAGPQKVITPMPGKVIRVLVAAGDQVKAGGGLIVVEAMKMQNEIRAPKSGTVSRVLVTEGQAVRAQEALIVID
jgi:biotin carboxyl carrier protein